MIGTIIQASVSLEEFIVAISLRNSGVQPGLRRCNHTYHFAGPVVATHPDVLKLSILVIECEPCIHNERTNI